MSDLRKVFANGKAFIPFITAGDPTLEITERLVQEMAKAGADLVELGIPFSDPIAEGEVIQDANNRALSAGTTTDKIFAAVKRIRKSCDVPLAVMTYINPIFTYGTDRFMYNCREANISAVIVPDLPYEEREELLPFCVKHDVVLISMVAPTSNQRIRMIATEAQGFIYCVSSLGVTGVRQEISSKAEEMIRIAQEAKDIPCAVGFGISTPEQAAKMARFSDGVIVGSAIIKIIEQYKDACVPQVAQFVREMKETLK